MAFQILPQKNPVLTLTTDNVLQHLKDAGVVVRFYHEVSSLSELNPGVFGAPTQHAKSDTNTPAGELAARLRNDLRCGSTGILSLAEKLLGDPQAMQHGNLCIQNAEPNADGTFVYAIAHRWVGKLHLDVYRVSDVWDAGFVFLVSPQELGT